MTKAIHLHGKVHVAGQLQEADFAALAEAGIRTVVCNRPDGEAEGQLSSAEAQKWAQGAGLEFRYQPVAGYEVSDEAVVEMFSMLEASLQGPILFYCRTGTRCTLLWAQSAVAELGSEAVTRIAATAGYDLEPIRDILMERLDTAKAIAA